MEYSVKVKRELSQNDKIAVGLIFFYWLMYENVFFFNAYQGGAFLLALTMSLKFLLPCFLMWLSGLSKNLLLKGFTSLYSLIFVCFISWVGAVTALYGDAFEWVKLLPRVLFFYSTLNLFYKKPEIFDLFAKFFIAYVLFALVQYFMIYITSSDRSIIDVLGVNTAGLGGLYSNVSSAMTFPGLPIRIIRLTGFWNEPSNAAGSAFAAGFLALYLKSQGYKIWNKVSYLCFLAGFLALSNAGYFGLGLGLCVLLLCREKKQLSKAVFSNKVVALMLAMFLFSTVIFGRVYVIENEIENVFLLALVGVRVLGDSMVYGGRDIILWDVFEYVSLNPLGRGLYVPSQDDQLMSAQAPVYWLYAGGIIGLSLILIREFVMVIAGFKVAYANKGSTYIFAALAVVVGQQAIYGSWMNPNYLVISSALLAFHARLKLS